MSDIPTGGSEAPAVVAAAGPGGDGQPPRMMICAGATKAGTSWFYKTLSANPGCYLRSVKEVHYWDTFEAKARSWHVRDLARQRAEFEVRRVEFETTGPAWKARKLGRRVTDFHDLELMLEAPRADDSAYLHWLTGAAEGRLAADVTPAYATLPEEILARAVAVSPTVKFVFLLRDPVARLWSHVRMNAFRSLREGQELVDRANTLLDHVLKHGEEPGILMRGDYPALVGKLRRLVPAERLHVEYCERLFRPEGQADMARFLGLDSLGGDAEKPEHQGPKAEIRDNLRPVIMDALRDHYDWAAHEVGPLPPEWQARLMGKAA